MSKGSENEVGAKAEEQKAQAEAAEAEAAEAKAKEEKKKAAAAAAAAKEKAAKASAPGMNLALHYRYRDLHTINSDMLVGGRHTRSNSKWKRESTGRSKRGAKSQPSANMPAP